MKKYVPVLLSIATFCCGTAVAQLKSQPLVQVRIQSFEALTANAKRVTSALGLGTDWNPGSQLSAALGSPDLAGVDRKRTWQLAVVQRSRGVPPLITLYVPVTNFETFKSGLGDNSPLKGAGTPNEMFQSGEFAVVVIRTGQAGDISADEKQNVSAWVPARAAAPQLIELALQLDEAARQQALQILGIGRMAVAQGVASQKLPQDAPINPKALADLISLYFDGIETVLKGLQRLEVRFNLAEQTFTVTKALQAIPNSELERWLKTGGGGVADLAKQLDPKATASLAGAIGAKPAFMPLLKKVVRVSFQMQNQEVDEKLAAQIDRLMDALAPVKFVGSVEFAKGIAFSGFYEFPGAGAKETYASFKQFFTNAMPSMTGADKVYSSVEFKEGYRKIGSTPLDRFSMSFNLDAPMFKMPGQREAIERMWAGGKMEFDYAVKGNRLYLAHPDKMPGLLEATAPSQAAGGLGATANTALVGRANLLALIKQMMALNPAIPAGVREKAEKISTDAGDVRFRVDLDSGLSSRVEIPFKILEAFRQFQSAQ